MKIFYNGVRVREPSGRFSSFKKKTYWFFKRVFIGMGIVLTAVTLYIYGGLNNPIVKAELIEAETPILDRIAKCEAPGGHWKNGQVVINLNNNGTYDQGKFQINSIWNKKATELGYNLAVEEDNEAFAKWIYANRGTQDWYSSAKCWMK